VSDATHKSVLITCIAGLVFGFVLIAYSLGIANSRAISPLEQTVAAQERRIVALEQTVEVLEDRTDHTLMIDSQQVGVLYAPAGCTVFTTTEGCGPGTIVVGCR